MKRTDQTYLSGITEDYSNYRWYKGEAENPYIGDKEKPFAARLWEYEREFHFNYLDSQTDKPLKEAYQEWKKSFVEDYLPGKSPNPYGDPTDWSQSFETGIKKQYKGDF